MACATCHIPVMAVDAPTKLVWDWSTAGQDTEVKDPHRYMKEKGSFVYARQVPPEYAWYDGTGERYLKGDRIDPSGVVAVSKPSGSIRDPKARIWPFKIHRGKQPFDEKNQYLLVAQTYGPGGFWSEFNWDKALRLGAQASACPTVASMDSPPLKCIGRWRTWCSQENAHCNARIAMARKGAWIGPPWDMKEIRRIAEDARVWEW